VVHFDQERIENGENDPTIEASTKSTDVLAAVAVGGASPGL